MPRERARSFQPVSASFLLHEQHPGCRFGYSPEYRFGQTRFEVMNRIRFLASCLIFSAGLAGAASKGSVEPVNKDRDGIAIKGYDSVAYFEQNKPVRGSMD